MHTPLKSWEAAQDGAFCRICLRMRAPYSIFSLYFSLIAGNVWQRRVGSGLGPPPWIKPCPLYKLARRPVTPRARGVSHHTPLYRNDTKHAATSHTRLPCHAVSTTSFVPTIHCAETRCRVEMSCIARARPRFFGCRGWSNRCYDSVRQGGKLAREDTERGNHVRVLENANRQ